MDEKPVIIIGGGLWGTLLALRMKECLPHVNFRLYEASSQLGEKLPVSFHSTDVESSALQWLSALSSKNWPEFEVSFPRYCRRIPNRLFTLEPGTFHELAKARLGSNTVFLNREITPEEAQKEGSFVIDTLPRGYYKALGYQKTTGLLVSLRHPHRLQVPVTMDASVEQKAGFRYLQLLPTKDNLLIVKDVRFSSDPQLYHQEMEADILDELIKRRMTPDEILERESEFRKIPRHNEDHFHDGRVIRLDGFVHDITGDAIPDAVRLIERMVQTSFRLGELKSVMKVYREERSSKRNLLRYVNRMLYQAKTPCRERYQFFQSLNSMSPSIREKFYKGDMELLDILRTMIHTRIFPKKVFKLSPSLELSPQ